MDDRPQQSGARLEGGAAHTAWRSEGDPLLRLVDIGLMATIFLVPYFMGGRYATGQMVFVLLVAVTATCWCLRTLTDRGRRWVRTPADWIVPAGIALIALQWTPLPTAVLAAVTPKTTAYLPMWASAGDAVGWMGTWNRISLVPQATLGGLALFVAYGLLFFVVVQRVKSLADILRILRWIALSAAVMAGFGLLQYLLSNGKFLWIYQHPFRTTSVYVNGSFINRNHFTHLLALGLGPVLLGVVGAIRSGASRSRDHGGRHPLAADRWPAGETFWRVALGLIVFAGLMSLSRGGMIVMALALAVFMAHAYRARRLGRRLVVGGLAVATVVVAALSIHGYDRVALRLDDLRSASLDRLDRHRGRREIWAANLAVIADYPLLGTGVGSHREVHPMYRDDSPSVEYTHAENGYLQIAAETGLVGLALLLTGMAVCGSWSIRTALVLIPRPRKETAETVTSRERNRGCDDILGHAPKGSAAQVLLTSGAITAGLAVSAVHSLIDFVWYIPACMSITVILAACAARLWHLTQAELHSATTSNRCTARHRQAVQSQPAAAAPALRHQPFWLALTGVTIAASLWMVANRLPPALASPAWDGYLHQSLATARRQRLKLRAARNGAVDPVSLSDSESEQLTSAMIAELRQVVARYPGHARGHVRLAAAYLEQFDQLQRESPNAMDLSQIRDAAIASHFGSRAALDRWLERAFGPSVELLDKARWHARRSVQLCPLEGAAYLFLAELGFLQGADHQFTAACIEQALRVRPHDERVLFAAGKEAALQGDLAAAIRYWKECFHTGGAYQLQLVQLLAGQVPVAFFLENFEPRLEDLQLLHQFYRRVQRPEEMATFSAYYIDVARAEASKRPATEAAQIWLSASRICREFQQLDRSLACAEEAERVAPDDYQVHFTQATLRLAAGELAEAERQLRWCLSRKPTDKKLRTLLETAVRRRLASRAADP
jgi:O-antigen ligase/tetratricopeptide (TPR) repeat protein